MLPSARTLLLVDDDLLIRKALSFTLAQEGYHVVTAASGAEGLELLREQRVDLVLCDQIMPTMNGLEFLARVKDRYPDVLRIMLTGQTDARTAIDAINQGEIYRFLTKPWDDVELKVELHLAFEHLDELREARRSQAIGRRALLSLEDEHPRFGRIARAPGGAILLDDA